MLTCHNGLDSQNRLASPWKTQANYSRVRAPVSSCRSWVDVRQAGLVWWQFARSVRRLAGPAGLRERRTVRAQVSPERRAHRSQRRTGSPGRRLDNLDREKVKAIFTAARFQMVDKKQLERLRSRQRSERGGCRAERVDGCLHESRGRSPRQHATAVTDRSRTGIFARPANRGCAPRAISAIRLSKTVHMSCSDGGFRVRVAKVAACGYDVLFSTPIGGPVEVVDWPRSREVRSSSQ